jgi:predicted enzyme related to lactoylglutathione lyase
MSDHHVVHIEFSAQDREAAGKFYRELFGWEIVQMPEMNYATFSTGEKNVGGGFNPLSDSTPAGSVIVYIGTDDIDASLAKAESLGGKTITPKTEIPNMGWFAIFSDPTGNMVGLYTALMEAA